MAEESPEGPDNSQAQKSWWFWPWVVLSTVIWLSAFVARGAINSGWHKTFFEWYTLLVVGPFGIWCVWYLTRDWLRRRRK